MPESDMLTLKDRTLLVEACLIGGEWSKAGSGTIDVTNPATGAVIARVPNAGAEETRQAIVALLRERAATVSELAAVLDKPKGTLGHHMQVLADAGLVQVVRTKKVRALGLKHALSAKAASGELVILENLDLGAAKTSAVAKAVKEQGWKRVLVIDGADVNENFARAARNLEGVDVLPSMGANVYDILKRDTLVITRAGVEALEARLK